MRLHRWRGLRLWRWPKPGGARWLTPGMWLVMVAFAWVVTGCATVPPLHGGPGTPARAGLLQHGPEGTPREATSPESERRRRSVRMPAGSVVAVEDMGVLAAEAGLLEVDAFEKLLGYSGLDLTQDLPPRGRPLTPDAAARLLALLLHKPMTLGQYPPRMAAAHLLREVLEGGAVSREELLRRVERFGGVAVLRPDGYLAWVRNGGTQQKVAPVEWKDGSFRAHRFELGCFYSGRSGAFRLLDARMRPVDGPVLAEVYDDADVLNRTLDGAREASVELYHALGQLLSRPMDSLAALRHLPAGVAALIASSPAYWERFRYMTAGEQMKAVARLSTHLLMTWGTASAVTRTVTGAMAGAQVTMPVLSLSARGVLTLEQGVVTVGQAGAVALPVAGAVLMAQAPRDLPPGTRAALGEGPEVGAMHQTGRAGAGMGERPQHHVLPQEHREWFKQRGFTGDMDIDRFCVELEEAHHQAIHGGGNWRLGRTWPEEWNRMIMKVLRDAETRARRRLTPNEVLAIVAERMNRYDIPISFTSWRGR